MIARTDAFKVTKLACAVSENMGIDARLDAGYTRVDPIEIAGKEGIYVMARPLDKLLGAFVREDRIGIFLNSDRPTGMFHMTCAHELAHFYLGHVTTTDTETDYRSTAAAFELEADQFAYALMSPLKIVANILRGQGWNWEAVATPAKLYQLSLRLGLSYTATLWSLVRLRKLDGNLASQLAKVAPAEIKRALVPQGTELKSTQDVWHLGPRDKEFILEPRPDDHLVLELPTHASAGYLWSVSDGASVGYTLRPILIDRSRSRAHQSVPSEVLLVGGEGTMRFELEPSSSAVDQSVEAPVTVEFRETQPWTPEESGPADFSLQTKFEVIRTGLNEASRERLVEEMAK
jgi:Zn-dependent peptidase ImmA (M78 family)